jgi:predicted nucleic acid-binding protein
VIVVDASVLATALGDDGPDGDRARARLRGERLSAPELVDLEVASVLRRQVQGGDVDIRRAGLALADLAALPLRRAPHRPLLHRCWELRDNLTVYDASYVALAEALEVTLLTGDGRLARAPGPRCRVEVLRSASLPGASPSFLSCRVQNVHHIGGVCQLAGRWCGWVRGGLLDLGLSPGSWAVADGLGSGGHLGDGGVIGRGAA